MSGGKYANITLMKAIRWFGEIDILVRKHKAQDLFICKS
jgi:hypothetical protein